MKRKMKQKIIRILKNTPMTFQRTHIMTQVNNKKVASRQFSKRSKLK